MKRTMSNHEQSPEPVRLRVVATWDCEVYDVEPVDRAAAITAERIEFHGALRRMLASECASAKRLTVHVEPVAETPSARRVPSGQTRDADTTPPHRLLTDLIGKVDGGTPVTVQDLLALGEAVAAQFKASTEPVGGMAHTEYVGQLCQAIAPNIELTDDLGGRLAQLDNAICGLLFGPTDPAPSDVEDIRKAARREQAQGRSTSSRALFAAADSLQRLRAQFVHGLQARAAAEDEPSAAHLLDYIENDPAPKLPASTPVTMTVTEADKPKLYPDPECDDSQPPSGEGDDSQPGEEVSTAGEDWRAALRRLSDFAFDHAENGLVSMVAVRSEIEAILAATEASAEAPAPDAGEGGWCERLVGRLRHLHSQVHDFDALEEAANGLERQAAELRRIPGLEEGLRLARMENDLAARLDDYAARKVAANSRASEEWNEGYRCRQGEGWAIDSQLRRAEQAEAERDAGEDALHACELAAATALNWAGIWRVDVEPPGPDSGLQAQRTYRAVLAVIEDRNVQRTRAERAEAERDDRTRRLYAILGAANGDAGPLKDEWSVEDPLDAVKHLRDSYEQAEAERERLRAILDNAFAYLPRWEGREQMAYVDGNIDPHVVAVADEWAIREEQLAAEQRHSAKLVGLLRKVDRFDWKEAVRAFGPRELQAFRELRGEIDAALADAPAGGEEVS